MANVQQTQANIQAGAKDAQTAVTSAVNAGSALLANQQSALAAAMAAAANTNVDPNAQAGDAANAAQGQIGTPAGASALQAALSMLQSSGVAVPKAGTGLPATPAAGAKLAAPTLGNAAKTAVTNGVAAGAANTKAAGDSHAATTAGADAKSANLAAATPNVADQAALQQAVAKAEAQADAGTSDADAIAANAAAAAAAAQSGSTTSLAGTQQAVTNAAMTLSPPVGNTTAWADALSQKVVFLTSAHQQTAQLSLNPPDLGPLQVVLNVADKNATAMFMSSHQQVRDAVEAALPQLRESLAQNGIGLGSTTVSDQSAQQQFASFAQQQNGSGRGNGNGGQNGSGNGDDASDDSTITQTVASVRVSDRAVDTFA